MTVLKQLKALASLYGLKIKLNKMEDAYGRANLPDSLILIDKSQTKTEIIRTFFHELQHFIDAAEKKYPIWYKACINSEKINRKKAIKLIKRYGHRTEVFCDIRAEKLMKNYYPDIKYIKTYFNSARDRKAYLRYMGII